MFLIFVIPNEGTTLNDGTTSPSVQRQFKANERPSSTKEAVSLVLSGIAIESTNKIHY
jgi:hypothetical protein